MELNDRVGIKGTDITGHVDYVDTVTIDIRTEAALYTVPPALVELKPGVFAEPNAEDVVDADGVLYRRTHSRWTSDRVSSTWELLCDRSQKIVVYRRHQVILDR